MKLIPPELINCKSDAERRLFAYLKQVSFSAHDVALHSLNIGHHEYKRWGEADFVVITRRGLLLLEVKGGRVACKNGLWEFTNRFGDKETKRESPAAQASSAFFSLEKNYLKKQFGADLAGIPAGFAVVFADVPRLTGQESSALPEHPDEITAYKADCQGHNSFKAFLDRAYDYWASKKKNAKELPPALAARIAASLRPSFERVPSLDTQLRHVQRDLCEFTDEQYERLDEIAENDRIMITGGAGTGKTFLAAACARYEGSGGREALFVTRSPFLATFLKAQDLPEKVTVAAFAEIASLVGTREPFDTLIVDEGQDLCDPASLDNLELVLKGGWQKGRWRWFGDPNHQVSPSHPVDPDCYDYLRELGVKCRLKHNVRNSGRVVEAIAAYSAADVGQSRGDPERGKVSLLAAESPQEATAGIAQRLKNWLTGEGAASRNSIAVLVDETGDPPALARELTDMGFRAEALSQRALAKPGRDCVLVARIEDFKGLERPLVCIAGLGKDHERVSSVAYKALSRANHEVVLFAPSAAIEALVKNAVQASCAGGNS